jgi:hypothetical protein
MLASSDNDDKTGYGIAISSADFSILAEKMAAKIYIVSNKHYIQTQWRMSIISDYFESEQ